MSREWMFSWILTVKIDEEEMRTRKTTLTLEELELIEAMGDAFKETYSPRVPAELAYIVVIGDSSKLELEESDDPMNPGFANTWLSCSKTCEPRIMASVD